MITGMTVIWGELTTTNMAKRTHAWNAGKLYTPLCGGAGYPGYNIDATSTKPHCKACKFLYEYNRWQFGGRQ